MLTVSRNLLVPRFGTTPRGLTSVGFSPGGNNVTAMAANIPTIADETKSWCSISEGALANYSIGGADSVHSNRYPFSIKSIIAVLQTNVRQNSVQLWTLPVAMTPWPAGSHGSSDSSGSSGLSSNRTGTNSSEDILVCL